MTSLANLGLCSENLGYYAQVALLGISVLAVLKYIASKINGEFLHKGQLKKGKLALDKRNKSLNEFILKYEKEISKEDILSIVDLSVEELSEKIKSQEISSRKAYLCYALNAAIVGSKTNGIADADFEVGLKLAEKADEKIKKSKNVKDLPALFGVPMSIKDHVQLKGFVDSGGFCSLADNVGKEDCKLVEKLKELGIIPLCKSNVCQGLLSAESSNKLWGENKNVWDLKRTTGGSSGGEGSLVSSFCSPIGVGTDIAGSVRIPGNFNGIFSYLPTYNKLSKDGMLEMNGSRNSPWNTWVFSPGFFSRNLKDIIYLAKNVFGSFESFDLDKRRFNNEEFESKRKLKIGILKTHPHIAVCPDIIDSIEFMKKEFELKHNYEFVELDYNQFTKFFEAGFEMIYNSDALDKLYDGLKGEKPYEFYNSLILASKLPRFSISFLKKLLSFLGETRLSASLNYLKYHQSLSENFKKGEEFLDLKDESLNYINSLNIDSILMPVYPFPAPWIGHSDMTGSPPFPFFNMLVNMLCLPSVAFPTGTLTQKTYEKKFNDSVDKLIVKDLESAVGMPIGLQITGMPGKDEVALRLGKEASEILHEKIKFNSILDVNRKNDNFWRMRMQGESKKNN